MIIMAKSHFNNILHYVVDLFKEMRDVDHSLTGKITIQKCTIRTDIYVFVECEINLLYIDDIIRLRNCLKSFHISKNKLVHIIDVDRLSKLDYSVI